MHITKYYGKTYVKILISEHSKQIKHHIIKQLKNQLVVLVLSYCFSTFRYMNIGPPRNNYVLSLLRSLRPTRNLFTCQMCFHVLTCKYLVIRTIYYGPIFGIFFGRIQASRDTVLRFRPKYID